MRGDPPAGTRAPARWLAPARASWIPVALAVALAACRGDAKDPGAAEVARAAVVTTEHGQLRGRARGAVEVFRGIPYAAPPVGERRFGPPGPAPSWTGLRDAGRFGSKCPQLGLGAAPIGDEDCLTLNLWRPRAPSAKGALRPVMVFIHGGANVLGGGSDPQLDGRRLAAEQELVVVTINYRLGLLGFLAHPALRAESGSSGNWAYLDQIAALEWLARNVAAFGGDPERVTIVGQSAGALSVCVLLASPLAAGLFQAAILQSGGCDVAPLEQREAEGAALLQASGCAAAADPLACLRALPAEALVALTPALGPGVFDWILPVGGAVDGHVLPASPWQRFAAGAHAVVPTMIGTNAAETELFTPRSIDSCHGYSQAIGAQFEDAAARVLAAYPCTDDASARETYVAATTDALFGCEARRILSALAPAAERSGAALFRYSYAHTRGDPAVRELRAFHGAELQLVFGTMDRLGYDLPEAEAALAGIMQRSWAALAATGSPVHEGTPSWEPWTLERDNAAVFDWPVAAVDHLDGSRCASWSAP